MFDLFIILAFFLMLIIPCVIALIASVAEEGPTLGYAWTIRRMRSKVVDFLRV